MKAENKKKEKKKRMYNPVLNPEQVDFPTTLIMCDNN